MAFSPLNPLEGTSLIADPIYQYSLMTDRWRGTEGATERDLIDTVWLQRLRRIYQLQSARWVFPSAEHSRFQHSLGTMHVAGEFAQHLYPFMKRIFQDGIPSKFFIEELLRLAGLLHDVGHGPFCHFFDEHVLQRFGLTHEIMSQKVILEKLAGMIKGVRRSPHGMLEDGEELDPNYVAFLIRKPDGLDGADYPVWLQYLQQLFRGIFTVDNIDYVLRDSYMTGVAVGPVDWKRMLHYTLCHAEGLALDKRGASALNMFLNARLYLYTNVYYHRTTRSIDLQLVEIFPRTVEALFPYNPAENLDQYCDLTDWSLIEGVRRWQRARDTEKRDLARKWDELLARQLKWRSVYETTLTIKDLEIGRAGFIKKETVEQKIRESLPEKVRNIEFHVDMAHHDPRPLNPLHSEDSPLLIYDPVSKNVSREPLEELFKYIPAKVAICRVYGAWSRHNEILMEAATKTLGSSDHLGSYPTNV
ncbi:MAG: HD domain-containing protein [Proteobacteria bacterium]|nr:HD domain-containing protein [Pseudomonadota bacterium]